MSWFDTPANEGEGSNAATGWFGKVNSFFEDPALETRWEQRKLIEDHQRVANTLWWEEVAEERRIQQGKAMRNERPAYWTERPADATPKPILQRAARGKGVPETRFADTFLGIAKPGDRRLPERVLRSRRVASGCGWHQGDDKKYWTEVTSGGHLTIRIDEKTGELKKFEGVGIRTCPKCHRNFRQTSGTVEVHRQPVTHRGADWIAEATGLDRFMPANWSWVKGLVGRHMLKRE